MTPQEIKRMRLFRGLTQEQAAQKIGVSFVTWNSWENGRNKPSPMAVQLIEKEFKNG